MFLCLKEFNFCFLSRILIITLSLFFFLNSMSFAYDKEVFKDEEELDLYCLKKSYPDIKDTRVSLDGAIYLLISNDFGNHEILYSKAERSNVLPEYHVTDVRTSMLAPYPLEPDRPKLPEKFSPGRWRSMDLITAIYGNSKGEVLKNIVSMSFQGQKIKLSSNIEKLISSIDKELSLYLVEDKSILKFLSTKSGGGFIWRGVAGENYMSPHSYGIALDLSPKIAPYWRWSNLKYHPLQKDYPSKIVEIFEKYGFIWGGKWYEYDLMHFEYRPELICKAKHKKFVLPNSIKDIEK